MIHFASFGRRLWAFVLSLLVDLVVLAALRAIIGDGDVWPAFFVWYVMHHVGLVVEGGTIGHRLAGLRVVRADGTRLGVLPAIVREIAKVALSLPPLGLGMLWMLDEPQRRTWHDLLAGSVVVRETEQLAHAAPEWAQYPPWRREVRSAGRVGAPHPPTPPEAR